MRTIGDAIGTAGTVKDRNPHFSGYNDRIDHIVMCPKCNMGMAFTDILLVREQTAKGYHRRNWACPHCRCFIDHVTSVVKRDEYIPEDVSKSVPKWMRELA